MFSENLFTATLHQYCPFARSLVDKGTWAELWREGQGAAVSVLPVLGVLSWGRAVAVESKLSLQRFSGVERPTLQRGLEILWRSELLDTASIRGRTLEFSLADGLLDCTASRAGFRFGAWCIFGGSWSVLKPTQRSAYVALLAALRREAVGFDRDEFAQLSMSDRELLTEIEAFREGDYPESSDRLWRCLQMPYDVLADRTGVARSALVRTVTEVRELGYTAPFIPFEIERKTWYHLPLRARRHFLADYLNGQGHWSGTSAARRRISSRARARA